MSKSIKRRLLRAKMTLHQALQSILNINRNRKQLPFLDSPKAADTSNNLEQELKVLNKIAAQQAKLIQHYEQTLALVPQVSRDPFTRH